MAQFDRVIPPGGEGQIRLQVKTAGYQGNVIKSARVYTNDPNQKIIRLQLASFVRSAITVSPPVVRLYATEGTEASAVVTIRAGLDKPLQLTPSSFSLSEKVAYTLQELEEGRRFELRFTTLPGPSEAYSGILKLSTNYPEKREIIVRVKGRIQKKS